MNPSKNYIALTEGRMSRSEFLRQARQSFPNLIGAGNSFEDALKILTRRGLINEELVYRNKADKFPLEAIERGIRYELEVMDVYDIHHPSQEQYKKARQRAIDNLCKDPLYYINKVAEEIKQPTQEETEGDLKKVEAGTKHTLKEGKYIAEDEKSLSKAKGLFNNRANYNQWVRTNHPLAYQAWAKRPSDWTPEEREAVNALHRAAGSKTKLEEAPTEDNTQLNKKFLDLYIKYKDGNYQVKDKETGELKPGKKLAPETAAQKACMIVRKSMNAPRFRPDRNTIASCSVGRGKLQYQGEKDGVPSFNYAWSLKEDDVQEANNYSEISKDPVYTQFYQHYLRKAKEEKDPNAEKTARGKAKKAFVKYNEKKSMKEQQEKAVLKEHIIGIIGKVLNEAATANLAQLSDENASVAELPGIINNLENVVTEIESFWIKEQQKIQGIFDQVGNIKNEDGLPVGYKFVQPMIESLKKDLEPVLAKITLDDLKLPEAPAPDQTQVNDPNAQVDPNDPNAIPPVPEKKTVFSPAEPKEPLQEGSLQDGFYLGQVKKCLEYVHNGILDDPEKFEKAKPVILQALSKAPTNRRETVELKTWFLSKTRGNVQESKKNKRYTK